MGRIEQDQNLDESQDKAAKPRFQIEKLEERIAPYHRVGHYPKGHCGYYDYYCDNPGRKAGHNRRGYPL